MSDVESFVRFCESEFGTAVMDREARYVRQHVDVTDRILDVGCGIGSLEERMTACEMVGVDRSEPMVRTAQHRAPGQFILGDARAVPVRSDAVDATVFVATLEFVPDVDAALREALRVLDHDGTFIALLMNTDSAYVQSHLEREESYFQRMIHRDTAALADQILDHVDGTTEYFLGIEEETVVESSDPRTAAVTAVVGSPDQSTDPSGPADTGRTDN